MLRIGFQKPMLSILEAMETGRIAPTFTVGNMSTKISISFGSLVQIWSLIITTL
jgi:hypothetical protein